jgi:hypothetical protein
MGQGAKIQNLSTESLPLPAPLAGVLGPGQLCVVNASAATLAAYGIPGSTNGTIRVTDLGTTYTGPYQSQFQGSLNSDGTVGGSGLFGDGSDGTHTFDGTTTVLGMAPSTSIYTMTRDLFLDNAVINAGVTLVTAGYRIFCRGVLTVNGTIEWNGNAAALGVAGAALSAESVGGSFAGGAGGAASGNGAAGTNATTTLGGAGGAGGAGTGGGTAGAGGTATAPTAAEGGMRAVPFALMGQVLGNAGLTLVKGGAGGGGGSGDGTGTGGGGGGGGGPMVVAAWSLQFGIAGLISSNGGAGGVGGATNCGGGGGGGGGWLAVITHQTNGVSGTNFSVAGGAGGAAAGTGAAGTAGSSGTLIQVAA